jgi:hypothetical protein
MKLNKFLWSNYKETTQGKQAIELFSIRESTELLTKYVDDIKIEIDIEDSSIFIDELINFVSHPILPAVLDAEHAEKLFEEIINHGIHFQYENGDEAHYSPKEFDFLHLIPVLSTWLFYKYPDFFKPYFFTTKFHLLTQIADIFGIDLPKIPLKRYKEQRVKYYWQLCLIFMKFQEENEMSSSEFCAFLYDFAPKYIEQSQVSNEIELPKPTQIWLVGGNQRGGDFEFIDNYITGEQAFWQGNVDTKKGDIIIMYCLSPRSHIHSIWRATQNGIADPFFHYYSNIYIGQGIKVVPLTLKMLKEDQYFSKHPLVRKNLQGVNGYTFNSEDYQQIQRLIVQNGGDIENIPQLYSPIFSNNQVLKVERDVELILIEPFLKELGYNKSHWERQLAVRMGRGERNFPDYAFLTNKEKNYEVASMLIEAKYWIKNNKELEETFKQIYSYGLRLSSKILLIADKDAIWIYEKHKESFDRAKYIKKYWKELEQPDEFNKIKQLIGIK